MRRMDRYEDELKEERISRSDKNKELYQNIGSNTRYANISDITNANTYDISNVDQNSRTRENYQRMKEYSSIMPQPKIKRELEEFKNIYKEKENRVYDINSVMAEARKNRIDEEQESKRKLKNDKYNILLSMTKEELEEYRKERKEKYTHPDEEELRELIDTIASKTLAGELDKNTTVDLLSELMATSIMDKVEMPEKEEAEITEEDLLNDTSEDLKNTTPVKMNYDKLGEETEEVEEVTEEDIMDDENQDKSFVTNEKINAEELNKLKEELDEKEPISDSETDNDFYTRSMDLSNQDFEGEMDDEFKEKTMPIGVKILIFLIIIALIAAAAYIMYQKKII